VDRDRGGAGPLTVKRQEFVRLINAGMTISGAARQVGVARKTGTRWLRGWSQVTLSGEVVRYPSVFLTAAAAAQQPEGRAVGAAWQRAAGGRGRGRAPMVEERARFAELIEAGVTITEAARQLGIARKTATRWRHGWTSTSKRGGTRQHPGVCQPLKTEVSARFLSETERLRIGDLRQQGLSVRAIAGELGRDPATISRELRRNASGEAGAYFPFAAQQQAVARRARPGRGKLAADPELRAFVAERLGRKWSPEQIAHALREAFPEEPARQLSPETIYQTIYRGGTLEPPAGQPAVLRTGRRRRRPHRRPDARRRTKFTGMTPIAQRPAQVADRQEPGHWKGDLIIGANSRSAIGTVVERTSRFTILLHLPGRHTAEAVRDALIAALGPLPPQLLRSLTWDQGSELALHADVAQALRMPVFFCDPHSPWQRPTNENTNGLLRQYFPKSTNLRVHTTADLDAAACELNDRPRKTLGWATPASRLATFR
jgi:IS30 family transposase